MFPWLLRPPAERQQKTHQSNTKERSREQAKSDVGNRPARAPTFATGWVQTPRRSILDAENRQGKVESEKADQKQHPENDKAPPPVLAGEHMFPFLVLVRRRANAARDAVGDAGGDSAGARKHGRHEGAHT
eukprot:CAMPEP_0196148152 /NCGR_PEP_ID=MMETSP0910-20130528/27113_1 /TAXON_ID=49265 /ORGANISM="Thalassiosira rotula, Strain GSO102" /LENGTH=130 /DNA_ID=CAMNT_0041410783 /DNA_START=238 /DNA_END=626 /DNA_ORIENTATION=+